MSKRKTPPLTKSATTSKRAKSNLDSMLVIIDREERSCRVHTQETKELFAEMRRRAEAKISLADLVVKWKRMKSASEKKENSYWTELYRTYVSVVEHLPTLSTSVAQTSWWTEEQLNDRNSAMLFVSL